MHSVSFNIRWGATGSSVSMGMYLLSLLYHPYSNSGSVILPKSQLHPIVILEVCPEDRMCCLAATAEGGIDSGLAI